jgi:hypothetical protein
MTNITDHPDSADTAVVRRMVMSQRYRDTQAAINEPAQDTLYNAGSGETGN